MDKPQTLFLPDDFDRIYLKYFKKLKDEGKLRYDPSGWLNTKSDAIDQYIFMDTSEHRLIAPYYSDYYDQLYDHKSQIATLLSAWDDNDYQLDEFTLCSSVTIGSLAVLSLFTRIGVKQVFFETPAFYASISQAKGLGMEVDLLAAYQQNDFQLDLNLERMEKTGAYILWLTQPRMSLGTNQSIDFISDLYARIPENSYIVIDEASEQLFPSQLSGINTTKYPRIIKLRNIYKGLGINGVRMSYIAHHASLRGQVQREIENFQGAIDYFSLTHTVNWSKNISQFQMMSEIANSQTKDLCKDLSNRFNDEFISFSKLINGYVGSFSVDFAGFPFAYRKNREELLKYCYENGISIIVGATMKFAYHEQKEFIRINYFKPRSAIENAVEIISEYMRKRR